MNICVLGGSPKGDVSVTMQYARYLEKRFPAHSWTTVQAASRIALLEKNREKFDEVISSVKSADLVLWAFPLYFMTVCSQYKRFIELVEARGERASFAGKYAASFSTSIHFFDHTAHEYIRELSEDWGLRFVSFYSAAMNDLMKKSERDRLDAFAEDLFSVAAAKLLCPRISAALPAAGRSSAEGLAALPPPAPSPLASMAGGPGRPGGAFKSVVLVDYPAGPVGRMAERAAMSTGGSLTALESLGLAEHGCLGCLRCGAGECAYTGKDAFIDAYRRLVQGADLIVIAGSVRDRYLSSLWKAFLDRSFFNTHRRVLGGKRVVVLVSGPLSRLPVVRETLSAIFEWQGAALVDFVSDEAESAEELGALIDGACARAQASLERTAAAGMKTEATVPAATFRGIGGMKVFRDEIYGGLRIVFKADHRDYKKTGVYDFPLRNPFFRFGVWAAYWITSIPFILNGMRANMRALMVKPYASVISATKAKRDA